MNSRDGEHRRLTASPAVRRITGASRATTAGNSAPEYAHFLCIYADGKRNMHASQLLQQDTRQFIFGQAPVTEDFKHPDGYICDLKNRTEYTLAEHIERLFGNAKSKLENAY